MSYTRKEIPAEELAGQREIMARVRSLTESSPRPMLAFVDTYGCQQNESDSEKLRGMLSEMGYGFTRDESEADVVVINTCAVREHAEQRILGNVGALSHTKRANRDQIIAMCGCMVQEPGMAERIKRSYPYVDLVFGPHVVWRFPEYLERLLKKRKRIFDTTDDGGAIAEGLPVLRDGNVKAWLSIMYGCNNFCSYCIVPYVRGRERSRRPEDVIREARELVEAGYKDITLLGQNVNSYGKDLPDGVDFADIIRMVNDIPGEFLMRFMTSHPKDAGERLFAAMAECGKAARHIHLPFQAGSDRILAAMNRRYTKADYLEKVRLARSYMPDVVLTSDVIVGFPGETEEDFMETMDVLEQVRFDALFTFIYSKRPGTPAAELADDTPREVKQERFERLLDLQNRISGEKHAEYVGRTVRVLVDAESADERADMLGRTNGGRLVHITGKAEIGSFADVEIKDSNTWALYGRLV